jgi:glycosyltransferase involved in cell wall biosynthesis
MYTSATSNAALVTAVIPTRNRAHMVARAVRSVWMQTYPAIETVVVIDGEDPATEAAIEQMISLEPVNGPRIRVIVLGRNVGAAEARNIGVREASGEWVAFLDDDDEWLPEKIEKQMRLARASQCAFPVVSCRLEVRTLTRTYVWPRRLPAHGEPVSEYVLARRGLFQGEGVVSTITLLARRDLFRRVPFGPGQRRHQEWDWIFRAVDLAGAQLCFVDEALSIWHFEEDRPGISAANNWRYSYEWIERVRPLVTPRAYAAFLLTVVAALAARGGERRGCLEILSAAVRKGKPAAIDLLLFCGMFAIPQNYRRKLRTRFSQ